MNNKQIILSSLALDLRRVAQGYFRGSEKMADRFFQEALARGKEAETLELKSYLTKLLAEFKNIEHVSDMKAKAEDALMYSTLFQNAALSMR
jgi:uncharacterized protein (DUF1330 family)